MTSQKPHFFTEYNRRNPRVRMKSQMALGDLRVRPVCFVCPPFCHANNMKSKLRSLGAGRETWGGYGGS